MTRVCNECGEDMTSIMILKTDSGQFLEKCYCEECDNSIMVPTQNPNLMRTDGLDYKVAWEELKNMLKRADTELYKMANENKNLRLQGQHEGVQLALTYMDELKGGCEG